MYRYAYIIFFLKKNTYAKISLTMMQPCYDVSLPLVTVRSVSPSVLAPVTYASLCRWQLIALAFTGFSYSTLAALVTPGRRLRHCNPLNVSKSMCYPCVFYYMVDVVQAPEMSRYGEYCIWINPPCFFFKHGAQFSHFGGLDTWKVVFL